MLDIYRKYLISVPYFRKYHDIFQPCTAGRQGGEGIHVDVGRPSLLVLVKLLSTTLTF